MKYSYRKLALFLVMAQLIACSNKKEESSSLLKETKEAISAYVEENENAFIAVMDKHLAAVSARDMETLRSTLSPYGEMQLILPSTEIIDGVDGFMEYHREWFELPNWTIETEILNTEIGEMVGMAVISFIYREPDRNGRPYFNRMIVSYDLKKINDEWYVIKDHASSIEKSTDSEEN